MFKLMALVVTVAAPHETAILTARLPPMTLEECQRNIAPATAAVHNMFAQYAGGVKVKLRCFSSDQEVNSVEDFFTEDA